MELYLYSLVYLHSVHTDHCVLLRAWICICVAL